MWLFLEPVHLQKEITFKLHLLNILQDTLLLFHLRLQGWHENTELSFEQIWLPCEIFVDTRRGQICHGQIFT